MFALTQVPKKRPSDLTLGISSPRQTPMEHLRGGNCHSLLQSPQPLKTQICYIVRLPCNFLWGLCFLQGLRMSVSTLQIPPHLWSLLFSLWLSNMNFSMGRQSSPDCCQTCGKVRGRILSALAIGTREKSHAKAPSALTSPHCNFKSLDVTFTDLWWQS